jgi:hypothetical protein
MLTDAPVPGAVVTPADGDLLTWSVAVTAPETYSPAGGDPRPSPYAGRALKLTLKFPATYPFKPPEVSFEPSKMWHPQVRRARPRARPPPPWGPAPRRVVWDAPVGGAIGGRRRRHERPCRPHTRVAEGRQAHCPWSARGVRAGSLCRARRGPDRRLPLPRAPPLAPFLLPPAPRRSSSRPASCATTCWRRGGARRRWSRTSSPTSSSSSATRRTRTPWRCGAAGAGGEGGAGAAGGRRWGRGPRRRHRRSPRQLTPPRHAPRAPPSLLQADALSQLMSNVGEFERRASAAAR